jgi:type 1 glutamine amidotransferase
MKPSRARIPAITLGLTLLLSAAVPSHAAERPKPTDDELRKIASAAPRIAPAKPKQARRLLVFTLCKGYYHVSIPHGARALELAGQNTGAYTTVISEDPAVFEPASLRTFDAVCLMSALGEFFLPEDPSKVTPEALAAARKEDERLKANLYDYVRSGHGLVAIHGGIYAFNQTPAFADIMGAEFDAHPWNAHDLVVVKLDDPDHPVCAAFRRNGFALCDEGYQFKGPYSRNRVRLLYSMDTARMDMNRKNLRPDGDFGLGWVKRHGEGRVFYSALGHNNEEFWNPMLLEHFLAGIQFALGDLEADAVPRVGN